MTAAAMADDASFVTIGIDREAFSLPGAMVRGIRDVAPLPSILDGSASGLVGRRFRSVSVIGGDRFAVCNPPNLFSADDAVPVVPGSENAAALAVHAN